VIKVIKEEGELKWQKEWNVSKKGEKRKYFFPDIGERKYKKLQMGIKLSTMVTGHGTLRSYYYRSKIKEDAENVSRMGPKTNDKLIWEYAQIQEKDKEGTRKLQHIQLGPRKQLHNSFQNFLKFKYVLTHFSTKRTG